MAPRCSPPNPALRLQFAVAGRPPAPRNRGSARARPQPHRAHGAGTRERPRLGKPRAPRAVWPR
eukprot:6873605-Lingulodinium_polyedra.AAC.1